MKRILVLLSLIMTFVVTNACSQDVVYENQYGYIDRPDAHITASVVGDLSEEAVLESKTKEKGLTKEIILTDVPESFATGMQWKKAGKYAKSFFGHWLDSWRSMNVEYFLSHYSSDFNNGEKDFNAWAKRKRTLSKSKEYIKVNTTSVNLLKHPKNDIMAATFFQDYRSNNFSDQSWKRQFWKKENDGRWRIVFEAEIEGPHEPFLERFDN